MIARLQFTPVEIAQQLRPRLFRVTQYERIGVRGGFVRQQRGMHAADHDRVPLGAQLVGDAIGSQRRARDRGDADQIGGEFQIERLDAFVLNGDLGIQVLRHQSGQGRERQRRHTAVRS